MPDVVLCVTSTMASIVAGCLVAPVGRLCGHVISYDSHVRELDHEVHKLRNKKDEVQDLITAAKEKNKTIKTRVNEWVEAVKEDTQEARRFLDDISTKKTCFCGWLPNVKVRYRLGREVRTKAKRIQELIELKPSGQVYNNPSVDIIFKLRTPIFQSIIEALNDEKVKVIGIYGPSGVGKTRLLEEVENKLDDEGRPFHKIVKSVVSQTPDLRKIRGDIAKAFRLNLIDEPSEVKRRDLLLKRFQKNPSEKVLIILDDLWGALDLRAVGIPLADESRNCKYLLTSRDKSVLEQRLDAQRTFRLQGLRDRQVRMLFEKAVGDKVKDNEELISRAVLIVRKLGGLPFYFNIVASILTTSNVSEWDDRLTEIEGANIEIGEVELQPSGE